MDGLVADLFKKPCSPRSKCPEVSGRRAPCDQKRGSQRADLLERQALRLASAGRLAQKGFGGIEFSEQLSA